MQAIHPAVMGALLLLCCSAFATMSFSNLSSIDPKLGVNNSLTAIPDLPGDDFGFTIFWGREQLFEAPSIMVCIWAMRELALLDFEKDSIPQRGWIHPRFPQVQLLVSPPVGTDHLSVRFAMWVITATVRLIVTAKLNRSLDFVGFYKDKAIGAASLTQSPSNINVPYNSSHNNGSRPDHDGSWSAGFLFSFSNVSPQSNTTLGSGDKLHAKVQFLSTPIDRDDILMGVTWFILACAKDNKKRLFVLSIEFKATLSRITTIWNPVRQSQYPMTIGDLISFLAYLPEYLLQQQMFREMDIVITDDGVIVARGSFRAASIGNIMELSSNPNISIF